MRKMMATIGKSLVDIVVAYKRRALATEDPCPQAIASRTLVSIDGAVASARIPDSSQGCNNLPTERPVWL
ncbi:hypothetical protein BHE90_014085 [Fusarium euwallaceae]|uniref:Uncharacterized protein n=3 Tax=Fusarium solani species complex TaxID=232080 RepID=A0A428T9V9_9HYPO|nr:hypothetical protein CEP51_014071 [Fusarium floridanum]RSL98831.1 hypothetical protein CEP52_010114 [Fusarium oligoseptatum]RTE71515.1 hypothetical protein BHE90_014085 [Fusarium euwallaceae]